MPPTTPSLAAQPVRNSARNGTPIYLYLAGVGSVGSALLRQLAAASRPALRLAGACTSRKAAWTASVEASAEKLAGRLQAGVQTDWEQILLQLEAGPRPLIFIDATGSRQVARYYARLLEAGVHVVTPSKLANTREQPYFDRLQEAVRTGRVHYRYETTVGAGLPVVQAVQDLVATGDRIRSIRGVVSGTLAFIFNGLRSGTPFSEAVREAIARGYAEPDVRDDLSGEDVARKFLILARTAGWKLERDAIEVESLVPEALRAGSPQDFLEALPAHDAAWQQRSAQAREAGQVLQYVGALTPEGVMVGVQPVSTEGTLGRLRGTDNLIEIRSDRYAETPLAIRGPGAGPEVTAAGVFADVLKVARAV